MQKCYQNNSKQGSQPQTELGLVIFFNRTRHDSGIPII